MPEKKKREDPERKKGQKKARGRPSKFTKEVKEKVIYALKLGNYLETAARYAGIHYDTLNEWLKRGEQEKRGDFSDFSESVKKARAEAEVMDLINIEKAARDGSWQASAWRLERSHPERWGRKHRLEHSDPAGGPTENRNVVIVRSKKRLLQRIEGNDGSRGRE